MSLNDPQWGKRGRSGPPDLDEIWRNVNRRLNEMFGRTTPPGDGEPPRRSLPIGGVGLLAALVLIVWLASGFYIVDEGRRGIVTHFGRFTEATQLIARRAMLFVSVRGTAEGVFPWRPDDDAVVVDIIGLGAVRAPVAVAAQVSARRGQVSGAV